MIERTKRNLSSGSGRHAARSACAVVLAGGQGTRIRHLYPDLPKPMVPVAGEPFIEWVVRYLRRQGVSEFVISLGHLAEVAEAHFAARAADGCRIATVRELTPLGTGGALAFAAGACTSSADVFVLANGDSLVLADLAPAWRMLADEATDGVLIGLKMADASRFGRLDVDSDGRLLRFSEKQPGPGLINAGIYLVRRRLLARFPRHTPASMEHEVFPALLAGGATLLVHRCQAPFLDIGTPETLGEAEAFIKRHFLSQVAA